MISSSRLAEILANCFFTLVGFNMALSNNHIAVITTIGWVMVVGGIGLWGVMFYEIFRKNKVKKSQ